ncbi:hypothetical protein CWE04_11430 [Thomasclavelia cocleata]|uniref:Radical SAM superfamily protein n=1 Tax=Thomasclavelia cocleata TaxID=69824 RepID=A0A1I0GDE7_9FIRM|nr:hypothetical protein [Thomasclavelia cocleata]MCR1959861.1 hypothetical protein [Thomasclavelia cocleata]NDO43211.1 hypothetical protein [Thomasclavelia cocleata]PJN79817.1 hypothetical protein CWE04_11430 [Thomasclavelia cocleata]SET68837.1 hypothetical protein SAMN04489758_12837 [Thomasclavelia cocleata]
MTVSLLRTYRNGNANIELYTDGTRICQTEDKEFNFKMPMNMDIKVTNCCTFGCDMCHENSSPEGKHAPLENFDFINSWVSGSEAALGGGMLTSYPHLDELLEKLYKKGIVTNATFHQDEFVSNIDKIKSWQEKGYLHGIGVSFIKESECLKEVYGEVENVVFHVIAGLVDYKELSYLINNFSNPKVLILGYKHFRRGNKLYEKNGVEIENRIIKLSRNIDWLFKNFKVVSFDNLALTQLNVRRWISDSAWDKFYQGEEGSSNMYVDAVEGKFARNSTSTKRYKLTNNIEEMFDVIKKQERNEQL